ncbi:MAG: hypothetical protein WKF78_06745 [Candidatus Limnocylindrales bacterium]
MSVARSLWASVQGDPKAMMRIHGVLTIAWLVAAVPILISDLKNSVPLLVFISIYANVAGHWSSWQASRVEVKQYEDAEGQEEIVEGAVRRVIQEEAS